MSTLKQHEKSDATAVADKEQIENVESAGEATMLVSEFPPPPYYYKQAISWKPPPIPNVALARGSRRAAAAAARARAADERQRLAASGDHQDDKTDAILGGEKDDKHDEEEGDVVAVLGEIVEDPFFVEPLDHCEDPVVVCNEMRRLNRYVLQGFVHLVRDLVDRPLENKYVCLF